MQRRGLLLYQVASGHQAGHVSAQVLVCGDVNISIKSLHVLGLTFLVAQWLRHGAFSAGYTGSIPGRGAKIPRAMLLGVANN